MNTSITVHAAIDHLARYNPDSHYNRDNVCAAVDGAARALGRDFDLTNSVRLAANLLERSSATREALIVQSLDLVVTILDTFGRQITSATGSESRTAHWPEKAMIVGPSLALSNMDMLVRSESRACRDTDLVNRVFLAALEALAAPAPPHALGQATDWHLMSLFNRRFESDLESPETLMRIVELLDAIVTKETGLADTPPPKTIQPTVMSGIVQTVEPYLADGLEPLVAHLENVLRGITKDGPRASELYINQTGTESYVFATMDKLMTT